MAEGMPYQAIAYIPDVQLALTQIRVLRFAHPGSIVVHRCGDSIFSAHRMAIQPLDNVLQQCRIFQYQLMGGKYFRFSGAEFLMHARL